MIIPPYDFSGIISTADQTNASYLPLESLLVHVFIADVSARVALSQVYAHHGSNILPEAYYVFPIPARAAVCSFEMRTSDGTRLKGIVKELSEAKEEYNEARSKGWLTGLLEQFRQDVFVVSIGTVPPGIEVTVTLSYVVDLSEDDQSETVRFQLSSHVGARYGAPPNSALYHGTAHRAGLRIVVDIEMPGVILAVRSLHHQLEDVSPITPRSSDGGHQNQRVRKQFVSSETSLDKDFLLIIHAEGLDRPRCFAEQLSYRGESQRNDGPTTALALTIVPQFDSSILPAQEYIFLIDRSGSMAGSNIQMAKQALVLFLKSLPSTSTRFNIYSFGSHFSSLWLQSEEYSEMTVSEAMSHVDNMEADMGGTRVLEALQHIFLTRNRNIPISLLVLTDGGISFIPPTIACVQQAVSSATIASPVRVFTLGIGHGASTALCQGLASSGNGVCLMTLEGEDLATKAIRLVKAMQTPPNVEELSINWGVTGPDVRQAPYRIPTPTPGMRLLVTAILPGDQAPTQVILKLRFSDGICHDYRVPVQPLSHHIPPSFTDAFGDKMDVPPLIHTLSAHLHIQDAEGGELQLYKWSGLSPAARRDVAKRFIVEIGTQYQVASSHTAFVAVAAPRPPVNPLLQRGSRSTHDSHKKSQDNGSATSQSTSHADHQSTNGPDNGSDNGSQGSHSQCQSSVPAEDSASHSGGHSKSSTSPGKDSWHTPRSPSRATSSSSSPKRCTNGKASHRSEASSRGENDSETPPMPGAFKIRHSSGGKSGAAQGLFDFFAYGPPPQQAEEILFIPNPLGSDHPPIMCTAPPLVQDTIIALMKSLWSRVFKSSQSALKRGGAISVFPVVQDSVLPAEVSSMARLQSFDGSFPHISQLSSIVGITGYRLYSSCPSVSPSEAVWAAAIAVAFLRRKYPLSVNMWGEIARKAISFGSGACGSVELFEAVVQQALNLFH